MRATEEATVKALKKVGKKRWLPLELKLLIAFLVLTGLGSGRRRTAALVDDLELIPRKNYEGVRGKMRRDRLPKILKQMRVPSGRYPTIPAESGRRIKHCKTNLAATKALLACFDGGLVGLKSKMADVAELL